MRRFIKLISIFIPVKKWRKKFRTKYLNKKKKSPIINSAYYGKIYFPYYPDIKITNQGLPKLYNEWGGVLDIYFIRDKVGCNCPYAGTSKYFLWDRFNIGLDTHFYTHETMLETMGKPIHRYGYFYESEAIIPEEYKIFDKYKGIEKDFDAVFTYSEKLLNKLDNAILFPSCATVWYSKEYYNGIQDPVQLDENLYQKKTKNISMICSSKLFTEMHKIRHKIASDALKTGKVDLFGGFLNGKMFAYKSSTLKDYRFQIVVENDITPYYFTEKIMDCFASQTIPVYLGATKINNFFNEDGIIKIDKDVDIEKVINNLNETEYQNRINAVKENYKKVMKYLNINDLLYETYLAKK